MPQITFMSWNIENFGEENILPAGSLIASGAYDFIAAVAHQKNVDVLGLMEMPLTNATPIFSGILDALKSYSDKWNGKIVGPSGGIGVKENYFIFFKEEHFKYEAHGLATEDKEGKSLVFPQAQGEVGGRPPGYCIFKKKDKNEYFSFLLIHAPGPGGVYTPMAGYYLGKVRELTHFDKNLNGNLVELSQSIVAGDFNVNWDDDTKFKYYLKEYSNRIIEEDTSSSIAGPTGKRKRTARQTSLAVKQSKRPKKVQYSSTKSECCYQNLEKAGFTDLINTEATSLIPYLLYAMDGFIVSGLNSKDFRSNAYDHIFGRKLGGTPASEVVDVIRMLSRKNKLEPAVKQYFLKPISDESNDKRKSDIEWFTSEGSRKKGKFNVSGEDSTEKTIGDCFTFYRNYISDHLPVLLRGNI